MDYLYAGNTQENITALNKAFSVGMRSPLNGYSGMRVNTSKVCTVYIRDFTIILKPSNTCIVVLPPAAEFLGREVRLVNKSIYAINSMATDIFTTNSTLVNSVLPATIGKYVVLQSNGTNWCIVESN